MKTRLFVKNKGNDARDVLVWKWKKGESTPLSAFGTNPVTYEICLGDAAGVRLWQAEAQTLYCGDACWFPTGNGFKLLNPSVDGFGGLRRIVLKSGLDGMASVVVKAQGVFLTLPEFGLPLPLPVTMRLSNDLGECWAETFTSLGVLENTTERFIGKAGSPSGAFID